MASNVLSRFLPSTNGEPSIYDILRQHDESSDQSDIEERAGMTFDEDNVGAPFHDYDLNNDFDDAAVESSAPPQTTEAPSRHHGARASRAGKHGRRRSKNTSRGAPVDYLDDEVPQSLLIEDHEELNSKHRRPQEPAIPPPIVGPPTRGTNAKWRATQQQQRLHEDQPARQALAFGSTRRIHHPGMLGTMDPKERAEWMWANVANMDGFLTQVYEYYLEHGIWSIVLNRLIFLLTVAFVVAFSIFLTNCIDYRKVPQSQTISQIMIPQCTKKMSISANILIWFFALLWIYRFFLDCYDIRRLRNLQHFYRHLLEIPDSDMQTISWQEVVNKLMRLRDSQPANVSGMKRKHREFIGSQSKQKLDAHDIANRVMRRDNYLIALFNKDILDFTLPVPFLRNRQIFSRFLEWTLNYCMLDFVFNKRGQVRSPFLQDRYRKELSQALKNRFILAGFINILFAPVLVLFLLLLYFFRYSTEYQRNPSQIGSRQYTPYAEWKFREFNELWHLFERRTKMSHPFASRYVDQFPKDKTIQVSRFVAFITGALASVLALASVIDPESFLAFEITPDRTVLFYLGLFGSIWAVARGTIPEENLVFDPEYALNNVIEYTHYMPAHWRGRLHTNEVRTEFAMLYQMKLRIFLEEILSIILTPFVLWFSLPKCSDRLVDFFREFTIHVDGLGYVCSFAVFDFKKGGSKVTQLDGGLAQDLREEYYSTKDGKMLASYYGFIDNYATNQRPGAPFLHPTNKQSFHAPPAFPGLMSPSLAAETSGPGRAGGADRLPRGPARSILSGATGTHQSIHHRVPRFPPAGGPASPMASILLDPHHQPSPESLRTQRKLGPQSRLRMSRIPFDDPIEDDEDNLQDHTHRSGDDGSEGADMALGESWKTTRAATRDDDADDDTDAKNDDIGVGVLGLVYQLSKAQTEGGGKGVNI